MIRADAEFLIIADIGPLLTAADMDGTTVDGTNLSLNGPIGRAIRDLDYTVVDPTSVSDTDVAAIPVADTDEFLDTITLYTLEAVLGNLDDTDLTVGPRQEKFSQLAVQVGQKIARLRTAMALAYGYGYAIPVAGYITKDIAEHD